MEHGAGNKVFSGGMANGRLHVSYYLLLPVVECPFPSPVAYLSGRN